jgi:acetolactate synthase-1/3 small subunit
MGTQAAPGSSPSGAAGQTRQRTGVNRHLLSALVQNQPGVLAQVSGMFASRGYNIDSLAVGETEDPHLSRINVVLMGDNRQLEQVRKQLEKLVPVVKVLDISGEDHVERDLMLIKVKAPAAERAEIQSLVQIFRARIVDVSPTQVMVEISGQEKKIEAFIEAVRPYGILELARTGRIALVRGVRHLEEAHDGPRGPFPDADADADEEGPPEEGEPLIQGHSNL